jgi:hypothetical protein
MIHGWPAAIKARSRDAEYGCGQILSQAKGILGIIPSFLL